MEQKLLDGSVSRASRGEKKAVHGRWDAGLVHEHGSLRLLQDCCMGKAGAHASVQGKETAGMVCAKGNGAMQ